MSTVKPRIQVTLTTAQHELLSRLAKLQSRSMSSIVSELFEQVHPVLERVAVVLQAAIRAQESMKEGLRESTARAEREITPHLAAAMGQLDLLQADFEGAQKPMEATARSERSERREGAEDPRPVTRGSGLARKGGNKSKSLIRRPGRPIRAKARVAVRKRAKR